MRNKKKNNLIGVLNMVVEDETSPPGLYLSLNSEEVFEIIFNSKEVTLKVNIIDNRNKKG